MRKWGFGLLFCAALLHLAAAVSAAATVDVSMAGLRFVPATVSITAGDTIRWVNEDSVAHTVTSGDACIADGLWSSGTVAPGEIFERVFNETGRHPYFCELDAHCSAFGMAGAVVVNDPLPVMSDPAGQMGFVYPPQVSPIMSGDPAAARPIGLGPVAEGGVIMGLRVNLASFLQPVDVYFAIVLSPEAVFFLKPDGTFQAASEGLVPWRPASLGGFDVSLFGNVSVEGFPPGTYQFLLGAATAGSLANFYLWTTYFVIPAP